MQDRTAWMFPARLRDGAIGRSPRLRGWAALPSYSPIYLRKSSQATGLPNLGIKLLPNDKGPSLSGCSSFWAAIRLFGEGLIGQSR